jgi:uncharacterized protein YgiM (DUF1202 family)
MGTGDNQQRPRRFRNISGKELDRRIILKAAAGIGTLAAAGGFSGLPLSPVGAQESGTRGTRFVPADQASDFTAAASGEWVTFTADYTFTALGASWSGDVGTWPQIEVQLSTDGESWSDTYLLTAQVEDGGPDNRGGRIFTWLILTDGASVVRYRTFDGDYNPAEVADLSLVYIDSSSGPTEDELTGLTAASEDTFASPPIINRESWGANESWRTWAPEYETVQHIIIHHTATSNNVTDWAGAVRSIYYYHAVEQGWGDIGYNYLVSPTGKIYEGRFGGQNVIGGHSYQYAIGSSGICVMGDYSNRDITAASEAALVAIVAWAARDLDPYGSGAFHEAPNLPVIASHRDVSSTSCPGDYLWNDLPEIRDLVASALDEGDLDTGKPGGIVIGDRVTVQTDDGAGLNVRTGADGSATGSVANGAIGWVIDGPQEGSDANWYKVEFDSITGWVTAEFLIVTPPAPPASDETFYFGVNIEINDTSFVRSGPSTSSTHIDTVNKGGLGFIMDGPRVANGYEWYQIAFRDSDSADGWVTKQVLTVSPVTDNPTAKFTVPANVVATESLNVRVRPGIAQTIQGTAAAGTKFQLTVDPVGINGYVFYGAYGPFGGGWVVEDYLKADAGTPPPTEGKFEVSDSVRVTESLNLRSTASPTGGVIGVMPAGTTATVLGGPTTAGGYTWWQIKTSTGSTGWAVQDWLEKTSTDPGTPPPTTGKFAINDTVSVTESLNMRSSANTSGSVITVLPAGTTGKVLGGPSTGSGYTWYRIQTSAGTGWVVQDWLTKSSGTPGTPPPSGGGKFKTGDAVRVTESLNLRSSAGTSGGVISVLPAGTNGTVTGGPTSANGYTWWQIKTFAGTGWAAEDWLAAGSGTSTPPPSSGIATGDTVKVIDGNLNLRASASTGSSVVAVLPDGTRLTVTGGPTSASGYTWYQVTSTSYGSGWVAGVYIQKV